MNWDSARPRFVLFLFFLPKGRGLCCVDVNMGYEIFPDESCIYLQKEFQI